MKDLLCDSIPFAYFLNFEAMPAKLKGEGNSAESSETDTGTRGFGRKSITLWSMLLTRGIRSFSTTAWAWVDPRSEYTRLLSSLCSFQLSQSDVISFVTVGH